MGEGIVQSVRTTEIHVHIQEFIFFVILQLYHVSRKSRFDSKKTYNSVCCWWQSRAATSEC